MEPKSSEQAPTPIGGSGESANKAVELGADSVPIVGVQERHLSSVETAGEAGNQVSQASAVAVDAAAVQQLPSPIQTVIQDDGDSTGSSNPTVAADDDLMEKEWVDRSKQVIAETKGDPYRREKEVNKLQIDYLKKRYGKELGKDAA